MPRYYFHLHNDVDVPDDEGTDLPDLAAARAYAVKQAQQLIGETVKDQARIVLSHRIDVEDEQHSVVATVQFRDVVKVEP